MAQPSQLADSGAVAPDFVAIQGEERFQRLRRRHRSFVFPLAVIFLLWYFLYVLLADYAHGFMSIKVFGSINIGLIFGLLQFVTTFGITTWYVIYSNRKLDPLAVEIREEIENNTIAGERGSGAPESGEVR
ncbi:DUF485 domain-containing protein [Psychromicrobium lacuslunae]|uniref:Membrane protein n=1 Tax=Psychromicrobium lacuslunae TaxID=1618207 RepID=A0A0D4BW41_9MICC|nr:DUF485 domain-containing protein [Psychromicrobium lacuslunae]AJT40519.1 membrane protein [Psychromicrobium lacuslunae]